MKLGFIGLGRMGRNMVLNLREKGIEVVAWNRSPQPMSDAKSLDDLIFKLDPPRNIWLMVTAGQAVDEMLDQLAEKLSPNDLIIDGGNSFYKDTLRREEMLSKKGIHFMDVGTSGGIEGARHGACMTVGGSKEDYERILPVLRVAAAPAAFGHLGPVGAGHFVKMMHNAIEYGYMQSIGEGFDVLEHAPYKLDLLKIAELWQKSSLISGFMMDRTVDVLKQDPQLKDILGVVDVTGEAQWAVEQAKKEKIPVEIIEASLNYRTRSRQDKKIQDSYTAKMIAALRHAFGAHGVQRK